MGLSLKEFVPHTSISNPSKIVDFTQVRTARGWFEPEQVMIKKPAFSGKDIGVSVAYNLLLQRQVDQNAAVCSVRANVDAQAQDLANLRVELGAQFEGSFIVRTDKGDKDIFKASRRYAPGSQKSLESRARALEKAFKNGQLEEVCTQRPDFATLLEDIQKQKIALTATRTDLYRESRRYKRVTEWINPWVDYFQNQGEIEAPRQNLKAEMLFLGRATRARYKDYARSLLRDTRHEEYMKQHYEQTEQLTREGQLRAWELAQDPKARVLHKKLEEIKAQRPKEFTFKRFSDPFKADLVATARASIKVAVIQLIKVGEVDASRKVLEDIRDQRVTWREAEAGKRKGLVGVWDEIKRKRKKVTPEYSKEGIKISVSAPLSVGVSY